MDQNKDFDELINFIKGYQIFKELKLTRETTLEYDMGISGDDIEQFFYDYSEKFKVDLSDFKPIKYFETDWLTSFLYFIRGKKLKIKEITIGDLEKGVIAGKLNDFIISK